MLRAFDFWSRAVVCGYPEPHDFATNVWKQALKCRSTSFYRPLSIAGELRRIFPEKIVADFV